MRLTKKQVGKSGIFQGFDGSRYRATFERMGANRMALVSYHVFRRGTIRPELVRAALAPMHHWRFVVDAPEHGGQSNEPTFSCTARNLDARAIAICDHVNARENRSSIEAMRRELHRVATAQERTHYGLRIVENQAAG